jgi:Zn-finger nucleic acid-binding protein
MNCPSCGAPMRLAHGDASLRCDYCRSVVVVETDDMGVHDQDQAEGLACPVCASSLWNATLSRFPVRACQRCHGLLIAMELFDALIEALRDRDERIRIPDAADPGDLKRITICPKCRQRMDTHFYYGGGSAVISGCERCSLNWLDGGVLMRIVRAPHPESADDGL